MGIGVRCDSGATGKWRNIAMDAERFTSRFHDPIRRAEIAADRAAAAMTQLLYEAYATPDAAAAASSETAARAAVRAG